LIERIFYCDGPDCERHVQTASPRPRGGFLFVTWDSKTLHFCGWDCVLRFAAKQEPEEVIPFHD